MKPVSLELLQYVVNAETNLFKYTSTISGFEKKCKSFLDARMDEIRLSKASDLVVDILKKSDFEDMDFFRQGVLNRESSGKISYAGQRDHSAHTLYNWLLGWYIYDYSEIMRDIISKEITVRRKWINQSFDDREYFCGIWEFTSLLHDIGYIFEGSLLSTDPSTQSEQAEVGLRIVKDYFESRFWMVCGFSSTYERSLLIKALKFFSHDFKTNQSMGKIADSLCNLGDLTGLKESINSLQKESSLDQIDELPGDSFDLWQKHYAKFELSTMVQRFERLRESFESLIYKGMTGAGIRVLDHGVCGGLILLLASTHYYNIRFSINSSDLENSTVEERRVVGKFKDRLTSSAEYNPLYWWTGIVWATAAVAIHNLQQSPKMWANQGFLGPLKIEEDPLAYLGILVDIIQDFDRYSVFPAPGKSPLQNTDVFFGNESGRIIISFPVDQAEKVKKSLTESLSDWSRIIQVEGHS